ncbi:vWA domain-containing protein [Halobellus ordinarius]|uniref:vWA domain-containing protein n=1 Tax=Halobellus ordinarius TaxID=3075120 RepID=UPI00288022DD|nr:VWA domain-containing protein [Halobellus sp. ZY16]
MTTSMNVELDRPYVPPEERSTVFAEVDIDPGSQPGTATRQVVICIDRSGSMDSMFSTGEAKIEQAQEGAKNVLGLLNDEDHLGIVSFNSRTSVTQDIQQFGDLDEGDVRTKIDGITANGGTDIYGALERSRDMLDGLPGGENTTKRILLLSDGEDNEKDAPDFEPLATEIGNNGVSIVSAGLGAAYDQPTIKTIGEASQGSWDHLDDAQGILQFFGSAIEDAGKTVISNPQVRIDAVSGVEVLGAFRRRPQVQEVNLQEAGGTYAVGLPDLLKRQQQQVMFELEVPGRPEGEVQLGDIHLDAGQQSLSESLQVEYTADTDLQQERNIDVWAKYHDADARTTLATADTQAALNEAKEKTEMVNAVAGDTQIATNLETSVTNVEESGKGEAEKEAKQGSTIVPDEDAFQ